MRFWLDLGVDGLRLDAIPYLCVAEGTQNENLPATHVVIKEMRRVLDAHYTNRIFLAEVNQWPEDVRDYFSDGDECHMAYHFPLMPRMYIAIAQEDRHPIVDIIRQIPNIPETCQWTIFLRNHDELTLEMVTDKERDYMYQTYISDSHARLNIGIRSRLAPLMGNEMDKIKLMNNLLLSMPGSPCIYYGDEIGMGDNFFLGDRNGLRTPMQWNPDRNAGFSHADPQRLYLPPIMDLEYGFGTVNVEAQLRERGSLLNWMRRVLIVRKNHRAFGRGALIFFHPVNRKILAYLRSYENDIILCVSNLSRNAQAVELDLSTYEGYIPVELMGRSVFPPIGQLPYLLTLPGHNYYWFLLTKDEAVAMAHEEHILTEELPTLVLFKGLQSFFSERVEHGHIAMADTVRAQLEEDILPHFVETQRWFGAKGEGVRRVAIQDYAAWGGTESPCLISLFRIEGTATEPLVYFIPLSLAWENDDEERYHAMIPATVAKVRHQARVGILGDAFGDAAFCRSMVQAMGAQQTLPCQQGSIRFSTTEAFALLTLGTTAEMTVRQPSTQGSNTVVVLNEQLFLKGYRHLQIGIQPEFDIGRFLTDVAHFPHTIPVLGIIEYHGNQGDLLTLALLQGYIENQGDCWSYTLDYLERFVEDLRTVVAPVEPTVQDEHSAFLVLMRTLGQRTGELHNALGMVTGDPAFDPEPITAKDLAGWVAQLQGEAKATLNLLELHAESLSGPAQAAANTLLPRRAALTERIQACGGEPMKAVKTRYHGDLHLGQVLLAQNDVMFIDFEGEPARPLAERLHKHSPLRDVAGMLRSFDYAAHTALVKVTADRPEDMALIDHALNDWEGQTGRVFLAAYDEAYHDSTLFSEQASTHGLLDLFLLEKALYEVRYELENRPDWVIIPLLGILSLLPADPPPP